MKNSKDFSGPAWSSDELSEYRYELTIGKKRAKQLLKAMDFAKTVPVDLNLNHLRLWDNDVNIFNGDDEVSCDVCCARVDSCGVYWDLKNKYTADVYETGTIDRKELEELVME